MMFNYMIDYMKMVKENPYIQLANLLMDLKFGQIKDKGGRPYKGHCIRVAMKFSEFLNENAINAALLHDLFEDTEIQDDFLREHGFSERTIWLISMLTRNKRVTYNQNIINICNTGDMTLMLIKLADNIDNKNPLRLHYLPDDDFKFLDKRYGKAREILIDGISKVNAEFFQSLDLNPFDFD